jgi:hypothetical protein
VDCVFSGRRHGDGDNVYGQKWIYLDYVGLFDEMKVQIAAFGGLAPRIGPEHSEIADSRAIGATICVISSML